MLLRAVASVEGEAEERLDRAAELGDVPAWWPGLRRVERVRAPEGGRPGELVIDLVALRPWSMRVSWHRDATGHTLRVVEGPLPTLAAGLRRVDEAPPRLELWLEIPPAMGLPRGLLLSLRDRELPQALAALLALPPLNSPGPAAPVESARSDG